MADQTAGNTETTAAAPTSAAAEASPSITKPTIPNPDAIHAEIIKRVRAAEAAKAEDKPADDGKPKVDPPQLKADPKIMKELGRLQGEVRKNEALAKEAETLKPDATAYREVQELWKGDREKRLEALAKIGGKDGLDVLSELVAMFYEEQQGDGGTQPTKIDDATAKTIADLRKEVDDLKAAGKTKEQTDAEAEKSKDAKAGDDYTRGLIAKHSARFPIMNRADNLSEAVDLVQKGAWAIAKREGFVDAATGALKPEVTAQQIDDLQSEAMTEVEAEFAKLGQRYGAPAQPKPEPWKLRFEGPPSRISKPTITPKPIVLSKNPDKAFNELVEQQKERAAAGGYR